MSESKLCESCFHPMKAISRPARNEHGEIIDLTLWECNNYGNCERGVKGLNEANVAVCGDFSRGYEGVDSSGEMCFTAGITDSNGDDNG